MPALAPVTRATRLAQRDIPVVELAIIKKIPNEQDFYAEIRRKIPSNPSLLAREEKNTMELTGLN
jgi:hypothetical protein